MDQQLKFNVLANVVGSEKIEKFVGGIDTLGNKMLGAASSIYVLDKARESLNYGLEQFKSILEYGDTLDKLSEKTGIGSQALSGYRAAADLANVSFEGLEKGLKKFSQQLGDPNAKEFNLTLKALGITSRDSTVVMGELADKFANMENGPKKAALAVSLFGKAGFDMIPFLNQGSEALSKFSVQFSADFARNAAEFNDTLTLSKNLILEQSIAISEKYIPVLTDIVSAWNDVQVANRNATNFDSSMVDLKAFASAVYFVFKDLTDLLDNTFTTISTEWTFLKTIANEAVNILSFSEVGKDWEAGDASIKKSLDEYKARAEARKKDVENFENSLLNSLDKKDKAAVKKSSSLSVDLPNSDSDVVDKFKKDQEGLIKLEKLKLDAYKLTSAELAKRNIEQQISNQSEKESLKLSESSKSKLAGVTAEIIKQRKALIDQEENNKASFSVGAERAFNSYLESVRDVSKQTEQLFSRAFNNMEESLVNFVKTGKASFRAFADAVIDDLIRISVRQATLGLVQSIGSIFIGGATGGAGAGGGGKGFAATPSAFADGGIMTSGGSIPLNRYANGGIANKPQMALFGEGRTPEAYVPLPDGRSIPVTMRGASEAGGDVFNIAVNVSSDGSSKTTGDATGRELANQIAIVVKNVLVAEKRNGGLLVR